MYLDTISFTVMIFTSTGQGEILTQIGWPAAEVIGAGGNAPVVLVCEHASAFIPPDLDDLGVSPEARLSHAAWDIGACNLSLRLSARMGAPLVAGALSRLVYDCNRPPGAADAIPATSEVYEVPGNMGLSAADKAARAADIHDPFHATLARVVGAQVAAAGGPVTLITLHSFTPVYNGQRRTLDIGYLHHYNSRLAQAALALETAAGRYTCALNEPYSITDGVTYTLRKHGEDHGFDALMIEIRNDLIDTAPGAQGMADHLHGILSGAIGGLAT